jgi:hypothetical protein
VNLLLGRKYTLVSDLIIKQPVLLILMTILLKIFKEIGEELLLWKKLIWTWSLVVDDCGNKPTFVSFLPNCHFNLKLLCYCRRWSSGRWSAFIYIRGEERATQICWKRCGY